MYCFVFSVHSYRADALGMTAHALMLNYSSGRKGYNDVDKNEEERQQMDQIM